MNPDDRLDPVSFHFHIVKYISLLSHEEVVALADAMTRLSDLKDRLRSAEKKVRDLRELRNEAYDALLNGDI